MTRLLLVAVSYDAYSYWVKLTHTTTCRAWVI